VSDGLVSPEKRPSAAPVLGIVLHHAKLPPNHRDTKK
jgi:hypothetical protein